MADMVYSALRRKLAAAQAVGDVQRINILRGMMRAGATKEVRTEVEAPEEAPVAVVETVEPPRDEVQFQATDDNAWWARSR